MSDEIDNLISEVSTLIASVTRDFQDTRYAVNMGLSASTPNTSASTTTETTNSTHSDGEQSLQETGIHLDGGGERGDESDTRDRQQAAAAATAQVPHIDPPVEYIDLSDTQNDTAAFSPPSSVSPAPAAAFPQPFVVDLCTPVRRRRSTASRRSRLYQPRINSRIPIDIPMPMQMPPMYDDDGIIQIEVLSAPIAPPPPTQRKRKSKERGGDLFKDSATDLNDSDAGASSDILKCAVCMESAYKQQPTSTKCGHVFCRECILQALRLTHKCPLCNTKITEKTLLRLYV